MVITPSSPRVLQRRVALFVELAARLRKLAVGAAQLALGAGKGAQGLRTCRGKGRAGVLDAGVLVHALNHAAGDNAVLQFGEHAVELRKTGAELRLRCGKCGILLIISVLVRCQQQHPVGLGILDGAMEVSSAAISSGERGDLYLALLVGQLSGFERGNGRVEFVEFCVDRVDLPLRFGDAFLRVLAGP